MNSTSRSGGPARRPRPQDPPLLDGRRVRRIDARTRDGDPLRTSDTAGTPGRERSPVTTTNAADSVRAMMLAVHVLDTLVRPVAEHSRGPGRCPRRTDRDLAAGTAGGTGLVLSRLGVQVRAAGAIGDDVGGEMLPCSSNARASIPHCCTGSPVAQTSASVLPIRPDGSVPPAASGCGANQFPRACSVGRLGGCRLRAPGAVEFYGGDLGARDPRAGHQHGAITSADSLAQGLPGSSTTSGGVAAHRLPAAPTTSR